MKSIHPDPNLGIAILLILFLVLLAIGTVLPLPSTQPTPSPWSPPIVMSWRTTPTPTPGWWHDIPTLLTLTPESRDVQTIP